MWISLYELIGGSSLIGVAILWPIFFFYSVLRIEKGIKQEGKPRPCRWDGIGGRAFWYCWTLALPANFFNEVDDILLDTNDLKRYANQADCVLAWGLLVCSLVFLICVLLDWIFGIV